MEKDKIIEIINYGETIVIDTFNEDMLFVEIIIKKYNNEIYYIKTEDYEPVFWKKLI